LRPVIWVWGGKEGDVVSFVGGLGKM
jgi:hypothetical protein